MKNCNFCNEQLEDNFLFCPYCGEAQNEQAQTLEIAKNKTAKLSVLAALANSVEDKKTLLLINGMIDNIK